ncbi:hypothetical protein D6779_07435 [Candidatus Parcubacteria bacterium]|nr:MAG: hypothetical protein D6779_07435 [Candidatus Parcubacteria bacterium]
MKKVSLPDPRQFFREATPEGKLRVLVAIAARAPSYCNLQPWRVKIAGRTAEVLINFQKELPCSDPKRRQLYISMGCFLENLFVAAAAFSVRFQFSLFPDPLLQETHLARFVVTQFPPEQQEEENCCRGAIEAIFNRRNNLLPFSAQLPPEGFLKWAQTLSDNEVNVTFITDEAQRATIVRAGADAIRDALAQKKIQKEFQEVIGHSLALHCNSAGEYSFVQRVLRKLLIASRGHTKSFAEHQQRIVARFLRYTPAFGIISTSTDDIAAWVRAGMIFEKISLRAERKGMQTGIYSFPIEIGRHYEALQEAAGTLFRPQVLFRIGYSKSRPHLTPRLPVAHLLVK